MRSGVSKRSAGAAATAAATTVALLVCGRLLDAAVVGSPRSAVGAAATVLAVTAATWPGYAPRPRRALDRAITTTGGVALAVGLLGLAGHLGVGAAPPGPVLVVSGAVLVLTLPLVHAVVRRAGERTVLVAGDDPAKIRETAAALDPPPAGQLSPPVLVDRSEPGSTADDGLRTDGGTRAPASTTRDDVPDRLSGLSRLHHVVEARDADRVALGYSTSDRQEFFGTLRTCRDLGVDAVVHPSHRGSTLLADRTVDEEAVLERQPVADGMGRDVDDGPPDAADSPPDAADGAPDAAAGPQDLDGLAAPSDGPNAGELAGAPATVRDVEEPELLDVAVPSLPWYSRLAKRGFDVCFAAAALAALSPLFVVVAVAVKLDSPGPVFYGQQRTGHLGETFRLLKFRSMVPDAEAEDGARLSDEDAGERDPRVTRVGCVLRATHLDEIPQLYAVLRGDMSVVGPRPERPPLEAALLAADVPWEKRWFMKPGLTGLAQIEEVTGFQPRRKLALDLEYYRRQSFLLDVRIVLAQFRIVGEHVLDLLRGEAE